MREHTYAAGEPNESAREGHGVSRRAFVVSGGTGLAAGAAMTGLAGCALGASARNAYRPEDVYVGDLLSAWGAINAGITTLLDWSHISNSPEHSDAAVQGLRESGIRAVYGYGTGAAGPRNQYPQDIRRLRKQYFNTDDQLLTLALATAFDPKHWEMAREVGAPITLHDNGSGLLLPLAKLMG